jgi:hypothetical protein
MGARRVWPISRRCLLLRGIWSYLRICRRSVLPYTRFCNCLLDYDCVLHIVNFSILYLCMIACSFPIVLSRVVLSPRRWSLLKHPLTDGGIYSFPYSCCWKTDILCLAVFQCVLASCLVVFSPANRRCIGVGKTIWFKSGYPLLAFLVVSYRHLLFHPALAICITLLTSADVGWFVLMSRSWVCGVCLYWWRRSVEFVLKMFSPSCSLVISARDGTSNSILVLDRAARVAGLPERLF